MLLGICFILCILSAFLSLGCTITLLRVEKNWNNDMKALQSEYERLSRLVEED
jgi:hypothetical protein